jgi:hypothetical protein
MNVPPLDSFDLDLSTCASRPVCVTVSPSFHHLRDLCRGPRADLHHRYGIAGLKSLARSKFSYQVSMHLDSAEFADACAEAYESTYHTDRGLRDVIIQTFRANPELSMRQDVEMVVRETPGLAFELFRMASGLPVSS